MIGIVIPAYNAGKYLSFTLDSVLEQTVQDWRLVIVDDGAKDDTAVIAQRYADQDQRIRVIRQANAGQSVARNRGFEELPPDCSSIIFLDADDVWEPDALAILSEALRANPGCGGVHGLARNIDGNGSLLWPGQQEASSRARMMVQRNLLVPVPLEDPTTFAALVTQNWVLTPGLCLLRAENYRQVMPFDPQATPCEDWDMWLRMTRHSPLAFINEVLLNYRRHSTNESSNRKRIRRGDLYVIEKHYRAPETSPEQRRLLRTGYRAGQLYFAQRKLDFARGRLSAHDYRGAALEVLRGCRLILEGVRGIH